ncbi:MAG: DUF1295 domain-containing protein [Cyclobacteriaceae bacterium]
MNLESTFEILLRAQFVFAAVTFLSLMFVTAPYGRFNRGGWGPAIKALYGWIIMEAPAVFMISYWFLISDKSYLSVVFIIIWLSHYLRRTFHYPFQTKGKNKPFPVLLVLMAIIFNCMNGFINGVEIFHLNEYSSGWLFGWKFMLGAVLFYLGYYINARSDHILSNMERGPDGGYTIPHEGFFKYVSCPHYFGEIVQWCGWAMLTWSWAGLAFAVYTFSNLAPRAFSHHKWYKKEFKDYPGNRKALVPFLV